MPSNAYNTIRQAIIDKHQIIATYDGYERELCPHVIGTKNGREQALFYQFGGYSRSGLAPAGAPGNWRCMPIDGLSNISVRPGDWHSAPNHSRPSTCVGEVDQVIEY